MLTSFGFAFTNSRCILYIPLLRSVILLKSWTSTGFFSNSSGSSVTSSQFSPFTEMKVAFLFIYAGHHLNVRDWLVPVYGGNIIMRFNEGRHKWFVCLTNFIWRSTPNAKCQLTFLKTKLNINWHPHSLLKYHFNVTCLVERVISVSNMSDDVWFCSPQVTLHVKFQIVCVNWHAFCLVQVFVCVWMSKTRKFKSCTKSTWMESWLHTQTYDWHGGGLMHCKRTYWRFNCTTSYCNCTI